MNNIIHSKIKSRLFFGFLLLVVLAVAAYTAENINNLEPHHNEELVPGLIFIGTSPDGNYIYKRGMVPKDSVNVNDYTNSARTRNYTPRTKTF